MKRQMSVVVAQLVGVNAAQNIQTDVSNVEANGHTVSMIDRIQRQQPRSNQQRQLTQMQLIYSRV
mgnify:CR=1 FL=1